MIKIYSKDYCVTVTYYKIAKKDWNTYLNLFEIKASETVKHRKIFHEEI